MKKETILTKDDLVIETFRAGGKGGQNANKVSAGVRVKHPESGAIGEARDTRDQILNKRAAFRRMTETPEFKVWLHLKTHPWEIKTEKYENGAWVEYEESPRKRNTRR